MTEEQYKILSAQQISQNAMIWQTPALAMAAQAFLLATALNSQTERAVSIILSAFSLIVGFASIQLMSKHRFIEVLASKRMEKFELANRHRGYSIIHRSYTKQELAGEWIARLSSYRVWRLVLIGFCAIALYVLVTKLIYQ